MDRIKSALFLDFDSIFGGLHSRDPQSAYDFAENSKEWLDALCAYDLPEDARRDLLIRRVYLNPRGGVKDEERSKKGWLSFQNFGPKLIQSGFEVMSCFSLTNRKNAADIHIVIDVLQSLNRMTLYDEFIIASSDSDFTPLLQCLRANGRRTIIISSKQTAPAYHNASDALINAADLLDMPPASSQNESPATDSPNKVQKAAENPSPKTKARTKPPLAETQSKPRESSGKTVAENKSMSASKPPSESSAVDTQNKVLKTARKLIANNKKVTLLSDISRELRNQFRQEIEQSPSKWFGHKTLAKFLLQNFDELKQDGNFVSLDGKSQNPKSSAKDLPGTASKRSAENLPKIVAQICQITDLPRLSADRWVETLKMLAGYAKSHEHEFKLSECSIWVRDQLKEKEIPVGRTAIDRIIKWAKHGGVNLESDPPPTADKIREAVIQNAVTRAGETNLDLTPEGQKELRNWLQGNDDSS